MKQFWEPWNKGTHLQSTNRRRQWHPTPVLLPGKSHGQRSLVGCSLWGREELDTNEWLHFLFSPSCIGEGNGNPLRVLAWRIPGTGEPGGLPSMGSHRVGHDWSDLAAAAGVTTNHSLCCLFWFPVSGFYLFCPTIPHDILSSCLFRLLWAETVS